VLVERARRLLPLGKEPLESRVIPSEGSQRSTHADLIARHKTFDADSRGQSQEESASAPKSASKFLTPGIRVNLGWISRTSGLFYLAGTWIAATLTLSTPSSAYERCRPAFAPTCCVVAVDLCGKKKL
jgi:hypothetical protein